MKILLPKVLLFTVFGYSQSIIVKSFGTCMSKIYIFDCLEKLTRLLIPNVFKWDSIFGGNLLFLNIIYLKEEYILSVKQKDNRKHFTLKR